MSWRHGTFQTIWMLTRVQCQPRWSTYLSFANYMKGDMCPISIWSMYLSKEFRGWPRPSCTFTTTIGVMYYNFLYLYNLFSNYTFLGGSLCGGLYIAFGILGFDPVICKWFFSRNTLSLFKFGFFNFQTPRNFKEISFTIKQTHLFFKAIQNMAYLFFNKTLEVFCRAYTLSHYRLLLFLLIMWNILSLHMNYLCSVLYSRSIVQSIHIEVHNVWSIQSYQILCNSQNKIDHLPITTRQKMKHFKQKAWKDRSNALIFFSKFLWLCTWSQKTDKKMMIHFENPHLSFHITINTHVSDTMFSKGVPWHVRCF